MCGIAHRKYNLHRFAETSTNIFLDHFSCCCIVWLATLYCTNGVKFKYCLYLIVSYTFWLPYSASYSMTGESFYTIEAVNFDTLSSRIQLDIYKFISQKSYVLLYNFVYIIFATIFLVYIHSHCARLQCDNWVHCSTARAI